MHYTRINRRSMLFCEICGLRSEPVLRRYRAGIL
jgi:hypothetical protein